MKMKKYFILIFLAIIYLTSCSKELPESYGVYIISDTELNTLNPQKLFFKGNMFYSISGLKGAKGKYFRDIDKIIVFEKDINPKNIVLTKLKFLEAAEVPNMFRKSYTKVNLWVSDIDIEIKIIPIENKADMYIIKPKNPLQNGFYAINYGQLKNGETLSAIDQVVYDFVVGNSIKPFQSLEEYNSENVDKQNFYENSSILLKKVNGYFNNKNYVELHKIYINTDKSIIDKEKWDKLIIGFNNWHSQSGRIISSSIKDWSCDGINGNFKLITEYEKAGNIEEEMDVTIINNKYYITFIGTKE